MPDQRNYLPAEHRLQFARRAGQQHQPAPLAIVAEGIGVNFHGQTGSRAVPVRQHHRAFRHQRLDARSFRHWPFARGEEFFHRRQGRRVFAEFFAEQFGNHVTREIVGGRTEAPGHDHEAGAR